MTELAENNAALEAEETNGTQAEAAEATQAQAESTEEVVVNETEETAAPAAAEEVLPARDADGFSSALGEGEGLQRKHVPGGVGYEVIFAVRTGDQQLVEDSSRRVRALIEENLDGAVDNVRTSEVRRFAYPIKKQAEGVYVVLNARFKPEQTGELDRFFKLDENVLRHMLLKEDR